MQIYLPIADLPVNIFLILGMGLAVGFISGMFGIGGGFLMTPLLIFLGVSPAVAVATVSSHIAASSCSGAISYWRRRTIDVPLAGLLLAGGIAGTASGVWLFTTLRSIGQLDITIGLSYVLLLGVIGCLMVIESVRAIMRARQGKPIELRRPGSHTWIHGLPLKLRFKRSRIYVSAIPVLAIGYIIGFVGAVMGIGGGFLLVPMLIYILRVPTVTVIGTSMVLTLVTMASATVMHAATNHLVDAVLALFLMVGGVVGAQFGARAGQRISGERLRLLLGLLVLAVDSAQGLVAEQDGPGEEEAEEQERQRLPGAAVADDDRPRLRVLPRRIEQRSDAVIADVARPVCLLVPGHAHPPGPKPCRLGEPNKSAFFGGRT